jgi:hypothetical protein
MKSCRNCANSRHDGAFRVDLVCLAFDMVVARPSMSTEENIKADAHCRNCANTCNEYTPEANNVN